MKCPACGDVDLVMAERQKIEIDYCPKCRGVWLDRGELDKIIERSVAQPVQSQPPGEPYGGSGEHGSRHGGHGGYGEHGGHGGRGYRRRSWLGDIFD